LSFLKKLFGTSRASVTSSTAKADTAGPLPAKEREVVSKLLALPKPWFGIPMSAAASAVNDDVYRKACLTACRQCGVTLPTDTNWTAVRNQMKLEFAAFTKKVKSGNNW
jgi:hypothetical protein